jgi:threonine synthase
MKSIRLNYSQPARRFSDFLPFNSPEQILDFGLRETALIDAVDLANWVGVKRLLLKVETTNPTLTVKDRITELTYSWFKLNDVREYAHCSTGNTGTSLVWGLENYDADFELTLFIPEQQLSHYNFVDSPRLKLFVLAGANYDQAKAYSKWYAKQYHNQPEHLSYKSDFRQQANKLPFLEAFYQAGSTQIDYVLQAISSGTGLIGADLAAQDMVQAGLLSKRPGISVIQPQAASAIVQNLQAGRTTYDDQFTQLDPAASVAWAIRRGDAAGCYAKIRELVVSTNGFAESASEAEIIEAKQKLHSLANVDSGYTAATVIAGLRKAVTKQPQLADNTMLAMITGADRATTVQPQNYQVITQSEWQSKL